MEEINDMSTQSEVQEALNTSCEQTVSESVNIQNTRLSKYIKVVLIIIVSFVIVTVATVLGYFHFEKQEALELNAKLEEVKWENMCEPFKEYVFNGGEDILRDLDIDKLNNVIDYLNDLQESYNNLSDYQKKYITEYENIQNSLIICEKAKEIHNLSNQLNQTIVDKMIKSYTN